MRAVRVSAEDLRSVTQMLASHDRDEMAVPSYTHRNPLIRWLFWKRLDEALRLAALQPGERVFEFGSGSGVLFPTLQSQSHSVAVTDLHLAPSQAMADRVGLPAEFVPPQDFSAWVDANPGRFDCIFALDVLEHVEGPELDALCQQFRKLLSKRGRLIVSGPTESTMYKLGRLIAGFKGDYHHRNIFDIDRELRRYWQVDSKTFVPGPPLPRAFLLSRYLPIAGN